ncbi:hypothetical protein EXIGLDRAFT_283407 [Exidia glandulosa HHB12029]|uniref:Uncharacterized protein n=1 Tax=Exidia glandulosa HHB12029 TaxID=1314781 RepID=A0A165DHV9_EXIGL|nr:hypothetical protein EXIGLDRAFT_283407 [Exidia glandulosa HHB12029]
MHDASMRPACCTSANASLGMRTFRAFRLFPRVEADTKMMPNASDRAEPPARASVLVSNHHHRRRQRNASRSSPRTHDVRGTCARASVAGVRARLHWLTLAVMSLVGLRSWRPAGRRAHLRTARLPELCNRRRRCLARRARRICGRHCSSTLRPTFL